VTPADFASFSNNAIAFASVVYALALVSHIAEWAFGRSVPAETSAVEQPVAVGVAADAAPSYDGPAAAGTGTVAAEPGDARFLLEHAGIEVGLLEVRLELGERERETLAVVCHILAPYLASLELSEDLAGEVVAQVRFRLAPRDPAEIKAAVAELLARRKATQPTTKRTFGSVFKNPPGELGAGRMIEECGLKGFRIGGALISPRHANFIENAGGATSADALALMVEARRRVQERFGVELEHEVRFLGPLDLPQP